MVAVPNLRVAAFPLLSHDEVRQAVRFGVFGASVSKNETVLGEFRPSTLSPTAACRRRHSDLTLCSDWLAPPILGALREVGAITTFLQTSINFLISLSGFSL